MIQETLLPRPPDLLPEEERRLQDQVKLRQLRQGGIWGRIVLFWLLLGPGLLVMIGDNDAGGVITYAATGATYGLSLFIPFLILMIPVAYVVQEMTVRLGAVVQKGHAELIHERFGPFWGFFSLIDLLLGNLLTLVTEFVGMAAGLSILGISLPLGVGISLGLLLFITLAGPYLAVERRILAFALLNLVFVPLAFMAHPNWHRVAGTFYHPSLPGGLTSQVIFLLIANVGTTIAPWMLFYQQGAVVDKGLTPTDIRHGRWDTFLGSVVMGTIAVAIVVLTGATLYHSGISLANYGSAQFAQALKPFLGIWGERLFALGLFEAGFVAASTISLSSAWAFGEIYRWPHSLNSRLKEAPGFYLIYSLGLIAAAALVLIPQAPLELISLTVQVLATILMPPALIFLLLLLNDPELMGSHRNGWLANASTGTIIAGILILTTVYALLTLFPHWLA